MLYTEDMDDSDQSLILRYLSGDVRAFDELVKRHLPSVYRFVLSYIKSSQDAEDVSQDTFIKALRHLKQYDLRRPFQPWLLQIAKRTALDAMRKNREVPVSALMDDQDSENVLDRLSDPRPSADIVVDQTMLVQQIKQAFLGLPKDVQVIFFLRYFRELNFREIAERVGGVLDTIKSKHRRGVLSLKKSLK